MTATGNINVVDQQHFEVMKTARSWRTPVTSMPKSISRPWQKWPAKAGATLRPFVEEFQIASDKRLIVLGEGRLINLAAAEGHPASVMDMSFANQALAAGYLVRDGRP